MKIDPMIITCKYFGYKFIKLVQLKNPIKFQKKYINKFRQIIQKLGFNTYSKGRDIDLFD